MEESKDVAQNLEEFQRDFLFFRGKVINQIVDLKIEIEAHYRAALEAGQHAPDENRLQMMRLGVEGQMRGAYTDETSQALGLEN